LGAAGGLPVSVDSAGDALAVLVLLIMMSIGGGGSGGSGGGCLL
jgi:hypothetical protein